MALNHTGDAIGAVSAMLRDSLHNHTGLNVTLGRPSQPGAQALNIYLYEASADASLKNISLDPGQPAPLWLVLKYLLTSFDDHGDSDTEQALIYLGRGLRALQGISFLPLSKQADGWIQAALRDNPEELKITFDEVGPDLLAKVMQNPEEKYRFSMGFQVRPVLIASPEAPAYSLLVGIDYTAGGVKIKEQDKIVLVEAVPSLAGPQLSKLQPERIEPADTITLTGSGFDIKQGGLLLGTQVVSLLASQCSGEQLVFSLSSLMAQNAISAGSWPMQAWVSLASGRKRFSNILLASILPSLEQVQFQAQPGAGTLLLQGRLLGSEADDIVAALYQNGRVVQMLGAGTSVMDQTSLAFHFSQGSQLPAGGTYRVILRVNGQQASNSPEVVFP